MTKFKWQTFPLICGIASFALYSLAEKLGTVTWLVFMTTYGVWFSLLVFLIVKRQSKLKNEDGLSFVAAGIILFFITFAYCSKQLGFMLNIRRLTFLLFNGAGYLLLLRWLLSLRVRFTDLLLLMVYSMGIALCFVDVETGSIEGLEFLVPAWVFFFLMHVEFIAGRKKT